MEDIISQIRAFNRYYTTVIGLMDEHILQSPYSLTEVRVMYESWRNPLITAREIKNILRVDEGYLSRLVHNMCRRNLLSKVRSGKDRRAYHLQLTAYGQREIENLNRRSSEEIAGLISHLSAEQQRELISHMQGIRDLLDKKQLSSDETSTLKTQNTH